MEPSDRSELHVLSPDPLCAGPDTAALVETYVTSNERHFVRNHAATPQLDGEGHRVVVDGLVDHERTFTAAELAREFPQSSVVATLQCAGNRRDELHRVRPFDGELLWGGEAIGTAEWSGVALSDLLAAVGVRPSASHVWFEGADQVSTANGSTAFGSGIAIERALAGDVLIASRMNGQPLSAVHGAPMRVVIPGAIGARSVKWLTRITLADRPSQNYFEVSGYRFRSLDDPGPGSSLTEAPLNSYIASPRDGTSINSGVVCISGYATARGLGSIKDVELAIDDGEWNPAFVIDASNPGVWVRWQLEADLAPGPHSIVVRASATGGDTQPADLAARWNVRGYVNDAWHRIQVYSKNLDDRRG